MAKTYFNNAIIGNSSMLGCLTDRGELVRLFWPNIDYPQHIESFAAGIFFMGLKHSTMWLHEETWQHCQRYVKDTNIVETVCVNHEKGLKVIQADFVLPDDDVLVRQYEIENTGKDKADLGFIIYSAGISTTSALLSTLFDFDTDALIHYRHSYYISISANSEVYQFQLGNNAFESAVGAELGGYDNIGMMNDGALSWMLGELAPGDKKTFMVGICASHTLKGVKKLARRFKASTPSIMRGETEKYWADFIKSAREVSTGREEIDELYKRSLLVFKLMSDDKTGGLLAAPEVDEEFTRCGRYAYCWGRDAAFITNALDKCGLSGTVDKFYRWAVKTQDDDGSWHQRYHMDGNLAPSWGLQIDETGTIIWGILEHYRRVGNKDFLEEMWDSVKKGVEFLVGFIDEETGLPRPSFDLWEERFGEHVYSSAAVHGGIRAGAEIAEILGADSMLIERWKAAAEQIKGAIERNFWKEDKRRFIRSVRVKLNPWGEEHSQFKTVVKVNPKGYCRDVTLEDWAIDVSLLGLTIPFGVFDVDDSRVADTVSAIEEALTSHPVGGIKRYEHDSYIGGNPWVLTTLWVALYHIRRKQFGKARDYFEWAVRARTGLGLLPEQVSKDTGDPAWVIPLTWSHAMFVLVLLELIEAGEML